MRIAFFIYDKYFLLRRLKQNSMLMVAVGYRLFEKLLSVRLKIAKSGLFFDNTNSCLFLQLVLF